MSSLVELILVCDEGAALSYGCAKERMVGIDTAIQNADARSPWCRTRDIPWKLGDITVQLGEGDAGLRSQVHQSDVTML
ncbi:hypothetical protein D3C81_1695270 [compost metagenome]